MLAETTWRIREALKRAEKLTGSDRYVDFGVRLYTVEQSEGAEAIEVYRERPTVKLLGYRDFGGVLDTRTFQFVAPSANPVVLYASREQMPLIVHGPDLPPRVLVYAAEGAGKTRGVLAPWLLLRALEFTGQHVEIGGTAPTAKRLTRLIDSLREILPPEWYSFRAHDNLMVLRNGVTFRLLSTKQYSEALGSPVQGFDLAACGSDELQDSLNANDDIEARGRRAPGGVYRRMCTATAKDSPVWREARDKIQSSKLWGIARIPGFSNPFVARAHWENMRDILDARAYARRVLAQDVRPERATYPAFDRATHVQPLPEIGARDVTHHVLARALGDDRFTLLIGHDPGRLCHVSVMLKAFELSSSRGAYAWFVIDELTSYGTSEEHATELVNLVRERYGVNKLRRRRPGGPLELDPLSPLAHVRIDPYGHSIDSPDHSVHTQFRRVGLHARSAAYRNGKGSGKIDKEARIEMVNRLLKSASGRTRLFFACDDTRRPFAKRTVDAIEMSNRDESGRAEADKKDSRDVSHWPASLGYALWRFERLRESDRTFKKAGS